ncbi:MAG: methyltransferase domain-containing protein [Kiritimatiellia bacterium]|nr:methyltransferase domain-containing protein [Kiritimatiellia bacterium]
MRSRYAVIEPYVRGKSVLDIGSVANLGGHTLWRFLDPLARELTGLDLIESGDPRIHFGNVESFSFGRSFEVIIFGSTLEHVDNQGQALDNMYSHLQDDGVMIITVPNAKWWTVVFKPHVEHVLWHDRYTLDAILTRHGFMGSELLYYPGSSLRMSFLHRCLYARHEILVICRKQRVEASFVPHVKSPPPG